MNTEPVIEQINFFGDIHKILFDKDRNEFLGVGRLSPTDVSRLLEKISEHYSNSKTKNGRSISELSSELAKRLFKECDFFADTYSYIAKGETLILDSVRKTIA